MPKIFIQFFITFALVLAFKPANAEIIPGRYDCELPSVPNRVLTLTPNLQTAIVDIAPKSAILNCNPLRRTFGGKTQILECAFPNTAFEDNIAVLRILQDEARMSNDHLNIEVKGPLLRAMNNPSSILRGHCQRRQ